jgi:hypothetical protein
MNQSSRRSYAPHRDPSAGRSRTGEIMAETEGELGIKALSVANWTEPDPIMSSGFFGRRSLADGQVRAVQQDEWAAALLAPRLDPHVAEEIRKLFAVARSCLLYGWFFYPLYTLGLGQLYRVLEAAVAFKCDEMGMPPPAKKRYWSYAERIAWLQRQEVIAAERSEVWRAWRELRNMTSHPLAQDILPPAIAISHLQRVEGEINTLLGGEGPLATGE